jgi:hypothetical protein
MLVFRSRSRTLDLISWTWLDLQPIISLQVEVVEYTHASCEMRP